MIEKYNLVWILISIGIINIIVVAIFIFIFYRKYHKVKAILAMQDHIYTIVAHDLKSPYIAMFRVFEKIKQGLASKNYDELEENLNYLENAGYSTRNILFNLLNWTQLARRSKIFDDNPTEIDINKLIIDTIAHFDHYAHLNQIRVCINVDKGLRYSLNRTALMVVIRNIVDNSIKHSKCSIIEIDGYIANEKLEIHIKDDGIGISKKQIGILLNQIPSKSKMNQIDGLNLGMALIIKYLKFANGIMDVKSSSEGTEFILTFE